MGSHGLVCPVSRRKPTALHILKLFSIYKPFQLLKQLEYSPSGVQVAEVYGWAVMVWCAWGADGSPPRSTSWNLPASIIPHRGFGPALCSRQCGPRQTEINQTPSLSGHTGCFLLCGQRDRTTPGGWEEGRRLGRDIAQRWWARKDQQQDAIGQDGRTGPLYSLLGYQDRTTVLASRISGQESSNG